MRAQCLHKVAVLLAYRNLAFSTTFGVRACAIERHHAAVLCDAACLQMNRFLAAQSCHALKLCELAVLWIAPVQLCIQPVGAVAATRHEHTHEHV